MTTTEPAPITTTADLARALLLLDALPPVERIARARRLVDIAKTVLAAAGDAAAVEACRTMRPAEVARQLGIGRSNITQAVARHAARTAPAGAGADTSAEPAPVPEQRAATSAS